MLPARQILVSGSDFHIDAISEFLRGRNLTAYTYTLDRIWETFDVFVGFLAIENVEEENLQGFVDTMNKARLGWIMAIEGEAEVWKVLFENSGFQGVTILHDYDNMAVLVGFK